MEPIFTKFPELPAEIRIQIWKEAAMSPRVVEVINGGENLLNISLRSKPSLLLTCKESHEIALPIYHGDSVLEYMNAKTYFNYDRDILYFPDRYFYNTTTRKQRLRAMKRSFLELVCRNRGGHMYQELHEPEITYGPRTGDTNLHIQMFTFLCETANQVKHIAISVTPNYDQDPDRFTYETCVEVARYDFQKLACHHNAPNMAIPKSPSITLIPGDVMERKSDTCILNRGPPTGITPCKTLRGGLRRVCLCGSGRRHTRSYYCDEECGNGYDFDLRVGYVSRMGDEGGEVTTKSHLMKLKSGIVSFWRKGKGKVKKVTNTVDGDGRARLL